MRYCTWISKIELAVIFVLQIVMCITVPSMHLHILNILQNFLFFMWYMYTKETEEVYGVCYKNLYVKLVLLVVVGFGIYLSSLDYKQYCKYIVVVSGVIFLLLFFDKKSKSAAAEKVSTLGCLIGLRVSLIMLLMCNLLCISLVHDMTMELIIVAFNFIFFIMLTFQHYLLIYHLTNRKYWNCVLIDVICVLVYLISFYLETMYQSNALNLIRFILIVLFLYTTDFVRKTQKSL